MSPAPKLSELPAKATPSDGEARSSKTLDVLEAYAIEGVASVKPKKRAAPRRYQLFDDGAGDFRLFSVVQAGHETLPAGALLPIPELGGYQDAIAAKKALRTFGASLVGKTVLLLRGVEIVRIEAETRPTIRIVEKPRKQVSGPVRSDDGAAMNAQSVRSNAQSDRS